ncbi:Protein NUCLEAR FUSION DEFECTIVE 6 chloroplastic/mitochondrial-like [Quillaja saponaria]|uniref:Protein NUCLEAR FUSION DEFECTIVE 6 chloroplastic/mitochondrial-like n=1 Tax=Quillaja saponaria TaxID=32244 RepID=A0AAD7PFY1_QUISA|nr:Protein NUCLEAR FUSION DEFECTIVE 6 chloroplastic/mitochondrial-like [Quillaja saponaria]
MAANCARRTLQFASASTRTQVSRSLSPAFSPNATKLSGIPSAKPASATRFSAQKRSFLFSRLPVELAGAQMSLIPLHSATATSLFTSLLSLHNNWGCLSEASKLWYVDVVSERMVLAPIS